ncbi:hypothetical protein [Oceanicola sp. 22II-s10i]|nr:hypothetical protein [Oceanicola sp. 22II-s10i]
MSYYMKAWLAAATLPVWLASSAWYDAVKIANAPLRVMLDAERNEDADA